MKITKLLTIGAMLLVTSFNIYGGSINIEQESHASCRSCSEEQCLEEFNHANQTRALLIDQDVSFNGEGTASFRYDSGYLRFYIENTGNKSINYQLKYPCGCKLVSSTLAAGNHDLFSSLDPEIHGHNPVGRYTLYVYNDDGSRGSFKVSARSIEK